MTKRLPHPVIPEADYMDDPLASFLCDFNVPRLPGVIGTGGFVTPNSGLFDGSTGYDSFSLATAADRKTGYIRAVVKRGKLGTTQAIASVRSGTTGNYGELVFLATNQIRLQVDDTSSYFTTFTEVFNDTSAYYDILAVWDTTQAAASDRLRVYVNGVQLTPSGGTYPSLNFATVFGQAGSWVHNIGALGGSSHFADLYACEVVWDFGVTASPTDFGKQDVNGNWVLINPTLSLTFSTDGRYYPDPSTGLDESGNGNDLTVNGTITQTADVPTDSAAQGVGDAATWQPFKVGSYSIPAFSNGNNTMAGANASWDKSILTLSARSGAYYEELIVDAISASDQLRIGLHGQDGSTNGDERLVLSNATYVTTSEGATLSPFTTAGKIVMVALSLDAQACWLGVDGTWMNGATDAEIEAGNTTNAVFKSLNALICWTIQAQINTSSSATKLTKRREADWTYATLTGFKALATQNFSPGQAITSGTAAEQNFVYTGGTPTQVVWGGTTYNPGDAGIDFFAFGFKITSGSATGVSWTATIGTNAGVAGVAQPRAQTN